MSTLVLTLAGVMQSWGAESRFTRRTTETAPTKSGVIGLLAAAQGRRRTDPIEDLLSLRFGVRVDQPGQVVRDFHTAHREQEAMPLSQRYYLTDAVFLAALEGEPDLIQALAEAVRRPHFLPYLGRRSCPPSRPLFTAVRPGLLEQVLASEPWQATSWGRSLIAGPYVLLETIMDAGPGEPTRDRPRDQPVSFDPQRRQHALRSVVRSQVRISTGTAQDRPHDPMALLGEA